MRALPDRESVGRRRVSLPRSRGAFRGIGFPFHIAEGLTSHLHSPDLHKREQSAAGCQEWGSVSHLAAVTAITEIPHF